MVRLHHEVHLLHGIVLLDVLSITFFLCISFSFFFSRMFRVFSGLLQRFSVGGEGSGDEFNWQIVFFFQPFVIDPAAAVVDHVICDKLSLLNLKGHLGIAKTD